MSSREFKRVSNQAVLGENKSVVFMLSLGPERFSAGSLSNNINVKSVSAMFNILMTSSQKQSSSHLFSQDFSEPYCMADK